MALAKKPDLARGNLAGVGNLGDKTSWWKSLQCMLIQKFGDRGPELGAVNNIINVAILICQTFVKSSWMEKCWSF